MPSRQLVARELAALCSVFSHPDRIRLVEELRSGEKDVNALQAVLGVTHSRTSQNLAILRSRRIVAERREGRHVFYRLVHPAIATWLLQGLPFIEVDPEAAEQRRTAIEEVRVQWGATPSGGDDSGT